MSPAPRRPFLAVIGGAVFTATAALVAAGVLTRLDQHAVTHLMPWLRPRHHAFVTISSLTLPGLHGSLARCLVDLWTYPAALVPSAVLVTAAAARLRATGRISAALTWCALWVGGNAVELAGKLGLERPALYRHGVHVTGFDHSLPSGHTIRSLVVAGALAWAWRRGWVAFLWAGTVPFALVALGDHTPTDVVAGAFVALLLAGWVPPRSSAGGDAAEGVVAGVRAGAPEPEVKGAGAPREPLE